MNKLKGKELSSYRDISETPPFQFSFRKKTGKLLVSFIM